MKKLFLGVVLVALFFSSCNKYADDFQELKDQIKALSTKVDGVAALQTQLTATTAQIAAIKLVVDALPTATAQTAQFKTVTDALTAMDGKITAINLALTNLAANGATAASVAAVKAQLDAMVTQNATDQGALVLKLNALQAKLDLAATAAQVTTLQSQILDAILASAHTTDLNVNAKIATLKTDIQNAILAGSADVNSKIAILQEIVEDANAANALQVQAVLDNIAALSGDVATGNAALQASVDALQLQLGAAQRDLTILLTATAMYNGDVTITTDAEVAFYLGKLFQMGIINGNLTINTENITLSMDSVNKIMAQVIAVIGTNPAVSVIHVGTTWGGWDWDDWGWWGWGGGVDVTITTLPGGPNNVTVFNAAGDNLAFPRLTSVRGSYMITGEDVNDPIIDNVGADVVLNYPGAYESTSLKTVGRNLVLVNQPSNGTGVINFPSVVIGNWVGDGAPLVPVDGTVDFNSTGTTSINFGLATGGQIHDLNAANALTIRLGTIAPNVLQIDAPKATAIDLTAATSSGGTIIVNTAPTVLAGTNLQLDNLATSAGDITVTMWDGVLANNGSVNLNKFNSPRHVTINGLLTVDKLMAWYGAAGSLLVAPQAQTVTLHKYQWLAGTTPTQPQLNAVKWLTLGGAADVVTLTTYNPSLLTANINGAVKQAGAPDPTHWASITAAVVSANTNLTGLTMSGLINYANLNGNAKLVNLTTTGVVNTLVLNNAAIITAVNLGHNAFVGAIGFGGPGSTLTVTNNPALLNLAPTALDWMNNLTVTGNGAMTHFNFSSYHTDIYSGAVAIVIDAPKVMGAYTPSIPPISAGNPGIQAIIASADIMTLKAYIQQVRSDIHITPSTFTINIGIPVATDLLTVMNADAAVWTTLFAYTNKVTAGGALNTDAELTLVQ